MKKIALSLSILCFILWMLNPSNQSFKDFKIFNLTANKQIDPELLEKNLVISKTSNFLILSIYEYTYTGPQKNADRRHNHNYESHTISVRGEYIAALGSFFNVYEQ